MDFMMAEQNFQTNKVAQGLYVVDAFGFVPGYFDKSRLYDVDSADADVSNCRREAVDFGAPKKVQNEAS
jgi:hypothetical protein